MSATCSRCDEHYDRCHCDKLKMDVLTQRLTEAEHCQPCTNFAPHEGGHTASACRECADGIVRFCVNCKKDHHSNGWESCPKSAERLECKHPLCRAAVALVKAVEEAYRSGLREGLTRFAWWKDGAQMVGTCGTTLAQALKEADEGPPVPIFTSVSGVRPKMRRGTRGD